MRYVRLPIADSRSPTSRSSVSPRVVARSRYALNTTYTTTAIVATTVASRSKSLPKTMLRSVSSKMSASTLRSEPKRRVENHAKPMAEYSVTAPRVSSTSVITPRSSASAAFEPLGSNWETSAVTVSAASAG